jgi:hypothetical protein
MLTMALIVQPYSQDACRIGYGAFSALGWAESRFGIELLVVFFSIVIVSVIIVSLDALPPLSSRQHLSHRASLAQRLVVTFLLLSSLSRHHHDHHRCRRRLVVIVSLLPPL